MKMAFLKETGVEIIQVEHLQQNGSEALLFWKNMQLIKETLLGMDSVGYFLQ